MPDKPRSATEAVEESLSQIEQKPDVISENRFLQRWNSATQELTFRCQNKNHAVEVGSRHCSSVSPRPDVMSKFRPQAVRKFREKYQVRGEDLHGQLVTALRKYIRYPDE